VALILLNLPRVLGVKDVSRRTKLLVLAAAIAAILYVLISPLPEMDATERNGIVIIVILAQVAFLTAAKLATDTERSAVSTVRRCCYKSPILPEIPDILAVLCVRTC
jgi:hypothetical protein